MEVLGRVSARTHMLLHAQVYAPPPTPPTPAKLAPARVSSSHPDPAGAQILPEIFAAGAGGGEAGEVAARGAAAGLRESVAACRDQVRPGEGETARGEQAEWDVRAFVRAFVRAYAIVSGVCAQLVGAQQVGLAVTLHSDRTRLGYDSDMRRFR
jgi:hypothetical protein